MVIDWLLERMAQWRDDPALVWQDEATTYGELLSAVEEWQRTLDQHQVQPGEVVALRGDYSPNSCALLLALIGRGAVVVPLTETAEVHREEYFQIAEVGRVVSFDQNDGFQMEKTGVEVKNPLTRGLQQSGAPGLVVFSSRSTGESKAALHDFAPLLEKFKVQRHRLTTLTFLLLDHLGGINTLLYAFSNGGTVVAISSRDPDTICAAIEKHKVELLPTSPTFLNLMLISEAYERYDLSPLKIVSYGTEVMPESTLHRVREVLPEVRLLQTYGLSELGVLRSRSRDSNSLWVKVGGEDFQTKVVDGILWIKARSAMLGYLNAPSPFDEDGWMNTGDMVEVDGEWLRILGRETELINVGGQKVYPAEVESVLLQMDNIKDAVVLGEKNPITGQIVTARVNLFEPEDPKALKSRVRKFCKERLASFKVPLKVEVSGQEQYSGRFKRMRRSESTS